MSITNLVNLKTLNGQQIKTSKKISFARSSYSSVDAIIAFLVKFNPAVEELDLSLMKILQSAFSAFSCSTHSYKYLCLELPDGISGCISLTDLNLNCCMALNGMF